MTIDLAGALVGQPTVAPAAAHKAVARTLRRGLLLMLTPAASAEDAASAGVAVASSVAGHPVIQTAVPFADNIAEIHHLAVLVVALFAKEVLYQRMGGVDYTPPAASAVVAGIPHANHLCH